MAAVLLERAQDLAVLDDSGDWDFGWSEDDGEVTPARVARALSLWAPERHQVFVILNTRTTAAAPPATASSSRSASTGRSWGTSSATRWAGSPTSTAGPNTYSDDEPGAVNVTANADRTTLKWRHLVAADTPIPTGAGSCAAYNQGPKPATWDDNRDVGLFEGATIGSTAYGLGLYRPVLSCRMNQNSPEFCPVCRPAMDAAVSPFLVTGSLPSRQEVGVDGYLRLVVRKSGTSLNVVDARELPGSFVEPDVLPVGLAHEVLLGGRRIAVGAMPDAGVERGFGDPARPTPEHSIRRLDTFDFVVRVPRERLRGADLSALRIDVVSVVRSRSEPLGTLSLRDEPGIDVVPVASLATPSPAALPAALRLAAES